MSSYEISSTEEYTTISYPDDEYYLDDGFVEIQDNGLTIEERPRGLERVGDYEPGGHHPIHLGDSLNSRYKVLHKLGSGGYAVVWLCRDTNNLSPQYVAIKVIAAEGSHSSCPELRVTKLAELGLSPELFCLPLDQFTIGGPNGHHFAFAYPVLGPRVSKLRHLALRDDAGPRLRRISAQVVEAMAALHKHGICHGDFRPANILVHVSGLNGLSEEDVLAAFGTPKTVPVIKNSGEMHDLPSAPQYLVRPVDWSSVELDKFGVTFISDGACVIDFGESYEVTSLPEDLGIPQVYCSPEYSLDKTMGIASDLWALGCTVIEIRTGRKLFATMDDDLDEYLAHLTLMLGKLPEPWWSTTWESRRRFFLDETDEKGAVIDAQPSRPDTTSPPRCFEDAILEGFCIETDTPWDDVRVAIPEDEVVLLADLLGRLVTLDPKERVSAKEILEHDWFKP